MAKFYGPVGYGNSVDKGNGVHELEVTEHFYRGDVIREARRTEGDDKVVSDLRPSHSISIVADKYANDHFFAIRYVQWMGALWVVTTVEVQSPRLLLRLGGVYSGPRPDTAPVIS